MIRTRRNRPAAVSATENAKTETVIGTVIAIGTGIEIVIGTGIANANEAALTDQAGLSEETGEAPGPLHPLTKTNRAPIEPLQAAAMALRIVARRKVNR